MVAEVDGLTDLGVGLVDGLAGLGAGDLDELGAPGGQDVTHTVQGGGPLGRVQGLPDAGRLGRRGHQGVDVGVRGQAGGAGLHLGHAPRGSRDGGSDVPGPLAVGGQGRVGVGLGDEGPPGALGHRAGLLGDARLPLGEPVLGAVGHRHRGVRVEVGQGRQEAVALAVEDLLVAGQVEDAGHEVLRRRVLLQAAHQVGDGDVELVGVDDGHVQQEVAGVAAHDLLDAGGHAGEHLELDAVLNAACSAQLEGEGDVEEVLARHAQADVAGALGRHRPGEHALVVGVSGLLGGPGGQLPAVDLGIDLLHGQVGALDDADLDARAAGGDTLGGPLLEALHGAQGVGQVGLQDDSGLVAAHFLLVEDRGEDRDGQVEILVVLHVQVEEGAVVAGQAVERQEGLDAVGDDFLEAPGVVGAGDGGDLDRDVVDVLAGDQAGDLGQTAGGLLLPQDGLAQEVDVEAIAALAQASEGGPESLVGGVDDEVANDLPEDSPGDRGDGARGEAGGGRAQPHGSGQGGRQEVGAPCRQALEGGAGDVEVGGTHDVVDEAGGEGQALGVGENAGKELG